MASYITDVDQYKQAGDDTQVTYAKAIYAYTPAHDDDLELYEGDLVTILRTGADGWNRVVKQGGIGLVPANYLELTAGPEHSPIRPRTNTNKMQRPKGQQALYYVRALYPFTALDDSQLTFNEGQVFKVIDDKDPDWAFVQMQDTNSKGFVPKNYIEKCARPASSSEDHSASLPPAHHMHEQQDIYATPEGVEAAAAAVVPVKTQAEIDRERCAELLPTLQSLREKYAKLEAELTRYDKEAKDLADQKTKLNQERVEYESQISSAQESQGDVQKQLEDAKSKVRQILSLAVC